MSGRPNLLLICTDQQSSTAMSCAGNADLHTPAMDAVAAAGLRFTRAYCTQPLCAPQRASFVTGHLPHAAGVVDNGGPLADGLAPQALGNRLAAAGYRCGLAGKWHVPGVTPEDCGFQVLCGTRDDEVPAASKRFLRDGKRAGPFFLFASFTNPHDVCQVARNQPLPQGPVPPPPSVAACPNLPANFDEPAHGPDLLRWVQRANPRIHPTDGFTPDDWRRLRWDYFRLVEKVDAEVGRLLTALDEAGHADDTLVLFTSDHGDGHGAHRWNQKTSLWEESIRVPLIARGPGVRAGATEARLASTGIDLLPTLCDAAGLGVPEGVAGRSLLPLLGSATEAAAETAPTGGAAWRTDVVVETMTPLGEGPGGPAAARALVGERTKYSVYALGRYREQLVDLQADPGEMVNLAVEARHAELLQAHRDRLRQLCAASGDAAGARLIP